MDFETVDPETLLSGRTDWLSDEQAGRLAEHPLGAVETEYPHYVREVESADGVDAPRDRHPVFYGCYDWHSAVHSHWALVRQLRLFDDHPDGGEIRASLDERLTEDGVAAEVEHFDANPTFERPYGWAWLLSLAGELARWDDPAADEWRSTLAPLEDRIRDLVAEDLLGADRAFRVGTHENTAFALARVHDYATSVGDDDLLADAEATALSLFADDTDYPVRYEPLGWDFVSPALTEADLLRRVYDPADFRAWVEGFLPDDPTVSPHDSLLEPASVSTDADAGVALHLVGLNLSKAWCLAGVADALGDDHEYADALAASAREHATRGLSQAFTENYSGSHWLSSFALYLLSREDGGIAPGAPSGDHGA